MAMKGIAFIRWGIILGSLCSAQVFSQPHNGQLYQQLIQTYIEGIDTTIQAINGVLDPAYLPEVSYDTLTGVVIELGEPEVLYEKLAPKRFKRSLTVSTRYRAKQPISDLRTLSDTLSMEQIKNIYRESPKALRGDKPTVSSKWIRPALLISLSIVGIVSLFFIRS